MKTYREVFYTIKNITLVYWKKIEKTAFVAKTKKYYISTILALFSLVFLFLSTSLTYKLYIRHYAAPYKASKYAILDIKKYVSNNEFPTTLENTKQLRKQLKLAINWFGKKYLKTKYSSQKYRIVALINQLYGKTDHYLTLVKQIDDLNIRMKFIQAAKELQGEIPEQRRIVITRRFDTDKNGNGYYEAVDMDNYKKIVVVGMPNKIRKFINGRQNKMWVSFVAELKYKQTITNRYPSYNVTKYVETYKFIPDTEEPEKIKELYLKMEKFLTEKQQVKEKLELKLEQYKNQEITPILQKLKQLM